jgi:hypothetical protein
VKYKNTFKTRSRGHIFGSLADGAFFGQVTRRLVQVQGPERIKKHKKLFVLKIARWFLTVLFSRAHSKTATMEQQLIFSFLKKKATQKNISDRRI